MSRICYYTVIFDGKWRWKSRLKIVRKVFCFSLTYDYFNSKLNEMIRSPSPKQYDWNFAKISRTGAEQLLTNESIGTFLVRESEHYPGNFTLSIKYTISFPAAIWSIHSKQLIKVVKSTACQLKPILHCFWGYLQSR